MITWECHLEINGPLNVGSKFNAICGGAQLSPPLRREKIKFELPAQSSKSLRLLNVDSVDPSSIRLLVTSYTPGNFDAQGVKVSDGEQSVLLSGFKFNVESVIKPDSTPQPFPAWDPVSIAIPLWIWLVLMGFFTVLITTVLFAIRANQKRKEFLKELEKESKVLTPAIEFNQFLRKMRNQREIEANRVESVQRAFIWALIRFTRKPLNNWKGPKIVKFLQNKFSKYEKEVQDIAWTLNEFDKLNLQKISDQDFQQLLEMSHRAIDGFSRIIREKKK